MSEAKLEHLLDLERIEDGFYRGQSWDLGFRALYGGQVLGQSIAAAYQTVEPTHVIHSLHSYFLLPGDAKKPVVYDIENVRDGRSFSSRRVKAIQNGRIIFDMTASFQKPEDGLSHQFAKMPKVASPDKVQQDIRFYEDNYDKLSDHMKESLSYHRPVDIRTVDSANGYTAEKRDPKRCIWMKSRDSLDDSPLSMHQASLAYASDYHFLSTSLQPHGLAVHDKSLRLATIDHAMWFHKPFKFDDWLLYEMESPFSGTARGLVQGKVFDQSGSLVASTMQEGLMRQISTK
ncbi:acyl-CoA thioesterase II [Glaciecola sp. MH2013]|uniref:acyl-CoA thioesterase II n=1 Tax=Glaciecola sp. MH2013 TaxID=2785524 RepID=UPI00189D819E|nr:acyl-CoA thioesterase II [Glaciecola sp. MH2013]MBF7072781.1 acyl-CoA thioesterase II [Glaciecola sp. MH2013]